MEVTTSTMDTATPALPTATPALELVPISALAVATRTTTMLRSMNATMSAQTLLQERPQPALTNVRNTRRNSRLDAAESNSLDRGAP